MEKEQLRNLISMFEGKYEINAKYVSIEGKIGKQRALMEQHPDIFYFASKTRVILVRWICAEIRRIFEKYNFNNISISTEVYDELRKGMQTKAFNRNTLCGLFGCHANQVLEYENFQKYEERYLKIYNMYAPTTKTNKEETPSYKPANVFNELNEILIDSREQDVLVSRSNGTTLDMIGEKLNVTRERARQIEVKPRQKIRRWLENRTDDILEKVCDNNAISENKIINAIGEKKWKIVKYVVSAEKGDYKWRYIKSIDKVIYDEDGKFDETAKRILKDSKKNGNSIGAFINLMHQEGYLFVTEDIAKKYFKSNNFNTFGEDVYEGKMTIGKASIIAVDKYYPNGIKLSDVNEVKKFAKIINEEYNLNVKPDRALLTRMQDVLIMCGKATYCSTNHISISQELIDKITDYVHSVKEDRVAYSVLFKKFENELKKENITNQYALHGLLKMNEYPCQIICLKHYVCKNHTESTLSKSYFKEFEQWLMEKGVPVSEEEILRKYDKWTNVNIKYAMSYYKNIVQWEGDFYFNVNCIKISDDIKTKLSNLLHSLTDNKYYYTSSYVLFDEAKKEMKDFLINNKISNEKQLYYVVQNIFFDQYVFRCPHISSDMSNDTFSTEDLVKLVTGNKTKVNKQEMAETLSKYYGNKNSSLSLAIQKHLLNYIRIGTYEYFRKDKIKLSEDDKKTIEEFIKTNMIKDEVFLPNKVTDYTGLPKVACGWNPWVICEMIDFLNLNFKKIEKKNTPSQNNMTIILSDDSKLKTKDEVLKWLILNDFSVERDKTVFAYAKQTGMYHTNLTSEEVNQKLNS